MESRLMVTVLGATSVLLIPACGIGSGTLAGQRPEQPATAGGQTQTQIDPATPTIDLAIKNDNVTVWMPAATPPPSAAHTHASASPVAARPGDPHWATELATEGAIEGYPSSTSVAPGETLAL